MGEFPTPAVGVAFVRPGQLDAVRQVLASEDEISLRDGRKLGWYLREIHGNTLLFRYSGHAASRATQAWDSALAPHLRPIRDTSENEGVFEPMERIFFEPGAEVSRSKEAARRIAMFTELKPEKEAWYRLLHANPWPDVVRAIHAANYRDFSIFLEEIDGRLYLFGWLEYVGEDFEADSAANSRDPASIRWWRETDACQMPPPEVEEGTWGAAEELRFAE